ncbi:hypothetical protein H0H81_006393 [Sphagnurus paluster]|uniref:Uncharacterized protein n=1 Tax=Sphagnurus paluster TaxID=117069 RepID=A0A9P7K7H1_9AGAR|nr:hypothetical protein H0H81_006393 [Sphagnurus paluster]
MDIKSPKGDIIKPDQDNKREALEDSPMKTFKHEDSSTQPMIVDTKHEDTTLADAPKLEKGFDDDLKIPVRSLLTPKAEATDIPQIKENTEDKLHVSAISDFGDH